MGTTSLQRRGNRGSPSCYDRRVRPQVRNSYYEPAMLIKSLPPARRVRQTVAAAFSSFSVAVASRYSRTQRSITADVFSTFVS